VLEDEDQPDRVVAPESGEALVRLADCQHLALDGDDLPWPRLRGPGLSRAVRPLDPVRVVPGKVGGATEPVRVGHQSIKRLPIDLFGHGGAPGADGSPA